MDVPRAESYTVTIKRKGDNTAIEDIETNKEGLSFVGEEIIGGIETTSMAIYSIDGRAARTAEGNRIATAGLAKGVYVIAVNSGKENKMYKFLIK